MNFIRSHVDGNYKSMVSAKSDSHQMRVWAHRKSTRLSLRATAAAASGAAGGGAPFHFRHFTVAQDRDSAEKISTDSLLLGSWAQAQQSCFQSGLHHDKGGGVLKLRDGGASEQITSDDPCVQTVTRIDCVTCRFELSVQTLRAFSRMRAQGTYPDSGHWYWDRSSCPHDGPKDSWGVPH